MKIGIMFNAALIMALCFPYASGLYAFDNPYPWRDGDISSTTDEGWLFLNAEIIAQGNNDKIGSEMPEDDGSSGEITKDDEKKGESAGERIGKDAEAINKEKESSGNETDEKIIEDEKKPDKEGKPGKRKIFRINHYQDSPRAGRIFIGAQGGCGISFPLGEVIGAGNQEVIPGFSYAAGIHAGLYLFEYGALTVAGQYAEKKFTVDRTYSQYPMKTDYIFSFVDIMLGFRGAYRFAYAEIGLFYGTKAGVWKENVNFNGLKYSSSSDLDWCRNELGAYGRIGFIINIIDNLAFDVGMIYKISFLNAYVNWDEFKTNQALITVGVMYTFERKLF